MPRSLGNSMTRTIPKRPSVFPPVVDVCVLNLYIDPFVLCQLKAVGDLHALGQELELASDSVRRLGRLLYEMEMLRSYLDPSELPYFDAKVIPCQAKALMAVRDLQGLSLFCL